LREEETVETLEQLGHRMQSVRDLQSVVKTMKGLAAVNIRQYEAAVDSLRDYYRTISRGLQILLRHHPAALAGAGNHQDGTLAMIVLGSDQGMCGQFNARVAGHGTREASQGVPGGRPEIVLAVGVRAGAEMESRNFAVDELLHLPSSVTQIGRRVQELLLRIDLWRYERGVARVWVVHQQPQSGAGYEPCLRHLIPLDAAWLHSLEQRPWPTRMLPTYAMDWRVLFSSLIQQYLFVTLYRAMAESLAAENAARMASMQAAERNVEERLDDLTARYHRRRQSAITEELLDVVAGFEMLNK
jgi:F-type H+-transporting ATPase subunit gamma